jgi:hypothetical protein
MAMVKDHPVGLFVMTIWTIGKPSIPSSPPFRRLLDGEGGTPRKTPQP